MTWRAFLTLLCTLLGLRGGQASDLPVVVDGMSRRAFLVALGVSAGALATAPFELDVPLVLDEPLGNRFVTVEWITREALTVLEKNLMFSRTINQNYARRFRA
jgi:hypothetical protein